MRSKTSKKAKTSHPGKRMGNNQSRSTRSKPIPHQPPPVNLSERFDFLQNPPEVSSSGSSSFGSDTRFNVLGTSSSSVEPRRSPRKTLTKSGTPKKTPTKRRNTSLNTTTGRRRKRRNHVLKEIRLYQRTYNMLMAKAPFQRLVFDLVNNRQSVASHWQPAEKISSKKN